MKGEIDAIRQALIELNALDDETREALDSMETALDQIDAEAAGTEENGVSGRWASLREKLLQWEEEHPTLALAVGRITNSLAAIGL